MEDITHVPLLILGGGISGMGAAFKAQEQGQEFLLLEAASQLGGCLSSMESAVIPLILVQIVALYQRILNTFWSI